MRINLNTNQFQQNNTNFKSKLPSVNATYNINKLTAKFIPDYWQQFANDSLTMAHYCRDKALEKTPLKDLLTKLVNNFDNNVLTLSCIKNNNEVYRYRFIFRLYKNTDEFLKDAKSVEDFIESKNYLNSEVSIIRKISGTYNVRANNSSTMYEKKYDEKDMLNYNDVDILTKVLNKIISPNTDEHRAIYNTYNNREEENFLKAFREQ